MLDETVWAIVAIGAVALFAAAIALIADWFDWLDAEKERYEKREVERHFHKTMQALDLYYPYDTEVRHDA